MKKAFSIIFTFLALSMVLDSLNVGHALMLFLLAGVIPGTNIVLSPAYTLDMFALLMGVVFGRMSSGAIRAISHRLAVQYSQPKAASLVK